MMKGYIKEDAIAVIQKYVKATDHPSVADILPELINQCIEADMEFMHSSGVLDDDGNAGENYYEDDDAFEFMVEKLVEQNNLTPEQAVKVASVVDDYMDGQQAYLEQVGLVDWE